MAAAEELVEFSPGTRIAGCWTIVKKLGAGAFGAVYLCRDDNGREGALKTEPLDASNALLAMEATVMQALEGHRSATGHHFCRCLGMGQDEQINTNTGRRTKFNFVVMSLVGRALDGIVREAGDHFSPGTAIGLSIQLLNALRTMHTVGYLHRDIKPANAAIGRPETNEQRLLYLIDFGMARKYLRDDGTPRRARPKAHFRGTPIYAPISAHIKRDYGPKDDIESWFYVMVKFYKGAVPWKYARDMNEIGEWKCRRMPDQPPEVRQKAFAELLGGCPPEFAQILAHIDALNQADRPNYEMIEQMLRAHLTNNHIKEHPYDWERNTQERGQSETKKKKDHSRERGSGGNKRK